MAKETYKTWLPVFPGFYETGYIDEDQINEQKDYYIEGDAEEADLPLDLVNYIVDKFGLYPEVRYEEYERALALQCCEWVQDTLQHIFDDKEIKVEFEKVSSPREYNFKNDSIDCAITIDLDKVMAYVKEESENFQKYLEDTYTDYDGFHSYYSNEIADWLDPEEWNLTHQVGSVLDFIIKDWCNRNHEYADESMLWDALDVPMEYMDGNSMLPDILKSPFIKTLAEEYMNEWQKSRDYLESHYHVEHLNIPQRRKLDGLAKDWLNWVFKGIRNAEQLEEVCNSGVTFEEHIRRIA